MRILLFLVLLLGGAVNVAAGESVAKMPMTGVVIETSTIPDPETHAGDTVLYTVMVEGHDDSRCVIVTPIIREGKLVPGNLLRTGDIVACELTPFDDARKELAGLEMFDRFNGSKNRYGYVENLVRTREESIADALAHAERVIEQHGGIDAWRKSNAKYLDNLDIAVKENQSRWVKDSYFAAAPINDNYAKYRRHGSFVEEVMKYQEYLNSLGIDLILLRLPTKGELSFDIFAEVPNNDFYQPGWMELYRELLANNIEVIDPLPLMVERRCDYPLMYFYNVPNDRHPFAASYVIAEAIAEVLKRYVVLPNNDFAPYWKEIRYAENSGARAYYPPGHPSFSAGDTMSFQGVFEGDARLPHYTGSSPFLFVGNSYGARPNVYQGASIPQSVSLLLNMRCDFMYRNVDPTDLLSNLVEERAELLDRRKAVIFIVHPSVWADLTPFPELTEEQKNMESRDNDGI